LHILKEFESKLLSTISEEKNDKAIAWKKWYNEELYNL
jgi:hypothetical protein